MSVVKLILERTHLENKIEWGLFTSASEAEKAKRRLNELNSIIDSKVARLSTIINNSGPEQ